MMASHRPATTTPVTFEALRAEVARRGFPYVADVYREFQERSPGFSIAVDRLIGWSNELAGSTTSPKPSTYSIWPPAAIPHPPSRTSPAAPSTNGPARHRPPPTATSTHWRSTHTIRWPASTSRNQPSPRSGYAPARACPAPRRKPEIHIVSHHIW
jgi:hypothetical protein